MVPLLEGRTLGWPVWTVALLVTALIAGAAFALVERRAERAGRPLLPPSILGVPSMRRGLLVVAPFFLGVGGFLFAIVLARRSMVSASTCSPPDAMAAFAVAFGIAALAVSRLGALLGRRVVAVGTIVLLVGLLTTAAVVTVGWPHPAPLAVAGGLVVVGFGQGMAAIPMFGVVLAGVPTEHAGVGSGALATTQQGSLAVGAALFGTLYAAVADSAGPLAAYLAVTAGHVIILAALAPVAAALPAAALPPAAGADIHGGVNRDTTPRQRCHRPVTF